MFHQLARLALMLILVPGCASGGRGVAGDGAANDAKAVVTVGAERQPIVATFSIVAFDPVTQELGVAVQSKFIAVGAVVPWAKAGVGAIATQSHANTTFGPRGLELMEKGVTPDEVLKQLTAADSGAALRQVGVVSAKGEAATFTGDKCNAWAGGKTGKHYAVQGNILAGQKVVDEMARAFEETRGELGARLIAALAAGQAAGGDTRGQQSAALLIVRDGWGYSGFNDRYRDIRVDDHEKPIEELARVYELHCRIFRKRQVEPTGEKKAP